MGMRSMQVNFGMQETLERYKEDNYKKDLFQKRKKKK